VTHVCLTLWLLAAGGVGALPVAPPADPIVTVWYRGTPAGTPVQQELAVIRALGFSGITWPASQTKTLEALKTMAASAGLQVLVSDSPKPASAESALTAGERVDLVVTPQNVGILTPLTWRAIAHGARVIGFDAGAATGAGLENRDRSLRAWVPAARAVARQFSANGNLIQTLAPGPGLIMTPESVPGLDVVMLDAGRSWVLIATNISNAAAAASVRLPAGAPYAIWADLLDNSSLAMAGEAAGPRWNLKMDANATRVYIIDKTIK
jgi:hypothetical protein